MQAIRSGDPYALLTECDNDDLAPLVERIVGRPGNGLSRSAKFQVFRPDHKKYTTEIIDELRAYGGHTLANAWRGFKGPPYQDIVYDVCKGLGVPAQKDDIVLNETALLKLFFEAQWESLDEAKKAEIISRSREKAASYNWDPRWAVLAAPASVFSLAPALVIATSSLGPNLKITAFCVLHIAYLRRKWLDGQEREANHRTPSATLAPTRSLMIGETEDRPLLTIGEFDMAGDAETWHRVSEEDASIHYLTPLLQAIPTLVKVADLHGAFGTKYMKVVAHGALAHAAGGGYRGYVLGPHGIVAHATLHAPSVLAGIISPAALLQIASVAVAQKHLADISQNLRRIKEDIREVHRFLENQRHAQLVGAIGYFDHITPFVFAGEQGAKYEGQLEAESSQLLKISEHLRLEIEQVVERIPELGAGTGLGTGELYEVTSAHLARLEALQKEFLLCARARACACQLLAALPGCRPRAEAGLQRIRQDVAWLAKDGDMVAGAAGSFRTKFREIESWFNSRSTIVERKFALFDRLDSWLTGVEAGLSGLQETIEGLDAPATMLLKLEEGKVTAIGGPAAAQLLEA